MEESYCFRPRDVKLFERNKTLNQTYRNKEKSFGYQARKENGPG